MKKYPALQVAEMTTETGYTWRTNVSAQTTAESLREYFVGHRVNVGAYDDLAEDEGEKIELVTDAKLIKGAE